MATPATFEILQQSQILGSLKFVSTNSVGPTGIIMTLTSVLVKPSSKLDMIHDDYGQLALDGEVLCDITTGSFGQITHPDTGLTSPVVDAYYIGKGIVSWKAVNDIDYRDIGNVPIFEFTPEVKTKPHYSSRLGVKTKDLEVVESKEAKVKLVMEEWTYDNMLLVLMGVAG